MAIRLDTEPETDWKNIFQIWRDNGEVVPFRVVRDSWSSTAAHYLVVERVEIGKWPYGRAWGTWHYVGSPPKSERIGVAGTYAWRLQRPTDPGYVAPEVVLPREAEPSLGECIHCGRPMPTTSSETALYVGICDDCLMADD